MMIHFFRPLHYSRSIVLYSTVGAAGPRPAVTSPAQYCRAGSWTHSPDADISTSTMAFSRQQSVDNLVVREYHPDIFVGAPGKEQPGE